MSAATAPTLTLDAASAGVELEVRELTSMAGFLALEAEWNALVEASDAGLFQRHECIRAWIEAFAPRARLAVLIARDGRGTLSAALPLLSERGHFCGLPARLLVAAANSHSCGFDMVALDPATAGRAFLAHLERRAGWDVLRIIDVADGGSAWGLYRAAQDRQLPVGTWEAERSPFLAFPRSYAELLAPKSPLFRANLRRRRRQLERLGTLSVERVTDELNLAERLEEGFALEQRGWKGKQGTAIAQDGRTRAFYTQRALDASRHGHLALFFLRLDGRPIAFHFGLVHRGIYYVPKLAYDESLVGCSPGLVLVEEAIQDGIARGLRGYDFLGGLAEWKTKWSSAVRPHHWLFVFPDTLIGRALRKAKFEWRPAARNALRTWSRPPATAEPSLFIPAFPTIRPEALLQPGANSIRTHYPFSVASARYFYFARNAIWRAAKELGLAGGTVLVPAYHHGVEIEALIDAGARVRFYSIGARFEVDLGEIEALIGPETKALYLTHFLGFPGPVRAMKALARKHGLPLVEDCALSLFSAAENLPLGVTGDVAIFCLYKVLAVPDGGVLLYPDAPNGRGAPHARGARPPLVSSIAVATSSMLRNVALRGGRAGRALRAGVLALGKRAMRASQVEPVLAGTQHFDPEHAHLGPSRLTEHLLRVQDVPGIVARRRRNYGFLLERLRDLSPPLFDTLPAGVVPLCYPLLVEDNRWFMQQLVARGIEAVDFWREGHPACPISDFPAVARLRASVVEIPCHQDLSLDTLALMVAAIRQTFAARARAVAKETG